MNTHNNFDCRFMLMLHSFPKTFTALSKEKTNQKSYFSNLQKLTYIPNFPECFYRCIRIPQVNAV